MMEVGFFGLGAMGSAMALNWQRRAARPWLSGLLTEANGLPRNVSSSWSGHALRELRLSDLRLATEAAQDAGRRLPMLDAVRERSGQAVDAGLGDKGWSITADYTLKLGR